MEKYLLNFVRAMLQLAIFLGLIWAVSLIPIPGMNLTVAAAIVFCTAYFSTPR